MPRINELWAFVADEGLEDEGLTAFQTSNGQWLPMVGADQARVDDLRLMAKIIAKETGQTIKLLRFKVREEVEIIEP